jgi:hypothetical protein
MTWHVCTFHHAVTVFSSAVLDEGRFKQHSCRLTVNESSLASLSVVLMMSFMAALTLVKTRQNCLSRTRGSWPTFRRQPQYHTWVVQSRGNEHPSAPAAGVLHAAVCRARRPFLFRRIFWFLYHRGGHRSFSRLCDRLSIILHAFVELALPEVLTGVRWRFSSSRMTPWGLAYRFQCFGAPSCLRLQGGLIYLINGSCLSQSEVKERVELYFYTLSGASWSVIRRTCVILSNSKLADWPYNKLERMRKTEGSLFRIDLDRILSDVRRKVYRNCQQLERKQSR